MPTLSHDIPDVVVLVRRRVEERGEDVVWNDSQSQRPPPVERGDSAVIPYDRDGCAGETGRADGEGEYFVCLGNTYASIYFSQCLPMHEVHLGFVMTL